MKLALWVFNSFLVYMILFWGIAGFIQFEVNALTCRNKWL